MSLVNKKGVDISSNNGSVDMERIKNAGYDFVMIRCGYGSDISEQDDNRWEENIKKAESAGIPWGAYFYSYSCSEAAARSELEHILRLLKGRRPTLPVALDMEDADGYHARHGGWNFENVDRTCRIILDGIAKAGYYPMLYTGFEEIENYISAEIAGKYDIWFAHWARSCGYRGKNLSMWQYGGEINLLESNSIDGVGTVDKNICYKDYPSIIKSGGFNGWGKNSAAPELSEPSAAAVQNWLNANYSADLEVDNIYGALTKAALIKALQTELNRQTDAGLAVDGVFGERTKAACINIYKGFSGNITRILQGFLLCRGLGAGGFDGIFGAGTEAAVREFQNKNNLTVDGIAGKETFYAVAA